jgi:DNA-binding NarL/FixJ family response regulator
MEQKTRLRIQATIYDGAGFLDAAFSAGASGYVTKARLSTDLIPAIHEAMLGRIFVSGRYPYDVTRQPTIRSL